MQTEPHQATRDEGLVRRRVVPDTPQLDLEQMHHDLRNAAHAMKLIGQMLSHMKGDTNLIQETSETLELEAGALDRLVVTLQYAIDSDRK